jgi:hypothetical protein
MMMEFPGKQHCITLAVEVNRCLIRLCRYATEGEVFGGKNPELKPLMVLDLVDDTGPTIFQVPLITSALLPHHPRLPPLPNLSPTESRRLGSTLESHDTTLDFVRQFFPRSCGNLLTREAFVEHVVSSNNSEGRRFAFCMTLQLRRPWCFYSFLDENGRQELPPAIAKVRVEAIYDV